MTDTISLASEPSRTTELVNGFTMTVTSSVNSTGKLFHLDQTNVVVETYSIAASQVLIFGPFPTIRKYRLECDSGSISYAFDKPAFDYATQLGNVQGFTGAKTLSSSDNGKIFRCDDGSNVIVTVPNNLSVGFNVSFSPWGAGTVTVAAASGATNRSGKTALGTQYQAGSLVVVKNADGASAEYLLNGDFA